MKTSWIVTFFLFLTWPLVQPQRLFHLADDATWDTYSSTLQTLLEEKGIFTNIFKLFHDFLVGLKSSSFPTAVASNISQQCLEDSQLYVHNLYQNRSLWAFQMQESSGQLPLGLFGSADLHADGLFDECLAVRAPSFEGQYCTVALKPVPVELSDVISPTQPEDSQLGRSNFVTIFQLLGLLSGSDRVVPKVTEADPDTHYLPSISFCLPSSCSAEDLGKAVAELVGGYVIYNKSIVTVADEQFCFKANQDPPSLDGPDITVIVVLSLLGLLVISATIHEAWRMYSGVGFDPIKDGQVINVWHCFSALNNGRKILSMKVSTTHSDLSCLHGIRFYSACWVVVGHTWDFCVHNALNRKEVKEDIVKWRMQTVSNGVMFVDTFFVISGVLVAYFLLRELDRNKGRFNIGMFYLRRYLRLTPVYAVLLGFMATLILYVATGPNWYNVEITVKGCRTTWWQHFLYIDNLFYSGEDSAKCMGHTWFLSANMQLFVFSPLFIYPLWRWKKIGLVWLISFMIFSHACIFALYADYETSPTKKIPNPMSSGPSEEYFKHYYIKPWTRAPPYLMGILTGWFLHFTKQTKNRLPKILVAFGWLLFFVVLLGFLYGLPPYAGKVQRPDMREIINLTYGPLHRLAWSVVVAWIVFACSSGYAGFLNTILSWKAYIPLSRLTYCVFLVHLDFLNVYYAASRKQFYYTMLGEMTTCLGVIIISFGLAFVVSVAVETSFLNLEKLVFSSSLKNKSNEENVVNSTD